MAPKSASASHGVVFTLLVVLVLCAVGSTQLHLSPLMNNLIIFSIAFIMAGLVTAQYMGLRIEGPLILWIVFIPTLLFAILVILLMPDVAHVPVEFLRFHH